MAGAGMSSTLLTTSSSPLSSPGTCSSQVFHPGGRVMRCEPGGVSGREFCGRDDGFCPVDGRLAGRKGTCMPHYRLSSAR